jgi:hypothetical protein
MKRNAKKAAEELRIMRLRRKGAKCMNCGLFWVCDVAPVERGLCSLWQESACPEGPRVKWRS